MIATFMNLFNVFIGTFYCWLFCFLYYLFLLLLLCVFYYFCIIYVIYLLLAAWGALLEKGRLQIQSINLWAELHRIVLLDIYARIALRFTSSVCFLLSTSTGQTGSPNETSRWCYYTELCPQPSSKHILHHDQVQQYKRSIDFHVIKENITFA